MVYQQHVLPDIGTILETLNNFCTNSYFGATCSYSRESQQYLLIHMKNQTLAVPRYLVREVYVPLRIQPVPGMSPQVEGVINIRGEIIPVINLFYYTGIGSQELPARPKLLITRNTPCTIALMAEQLGETLEVKREDIRQVQPGTFASSFLRQPGEHIPVPDIDHIMMKMIK